MDQIEDGEQYEMDKETRWLFVINFSMNKNFSILIIN